VGEIFGTCPDRP